MVDATNRELATLLAVKDWAAAARDLKALKEREMALRLTAIAAAFTPDVLDHAGTTTADVTGKLSLKLEIRRSAKVDQEKIGKALARLRRVAGDVGKLIGDRLITMKPSASVAEFTKLDPKHARIFKDVITIELGSPSLELIESGCTST
jgi:hypothetical protein